jgi:glyoxylase-like metal-dependent hydrolase (beta-lactamase superfamily II)
MKDTTMKFNIIFLLVSTLFSSVLVAQETQKSYIKLSDKFYLITKFNTKVGVSVGEDGLLIIDTPIEKHANELLAIVREISDKPIKLLINTHSDFDHTGGNELFSQHGAIILSQNNVIYSKAKHQVLIDNHSSIIFNQDKVNLVSVMSHSYSDLLIHFEKENVIFMGDVLGNKSHPTFYSGGINGLNNAFNTAISLANESTKFISGHGHVFNLLELKQHQKSVNDWVSAIKKYNEQGLSPSQILEHTDIKLLIQAFNGINRENNIKATRLVKFVERTLSTEFYHLKDVITNYSKYIGQYTNDKTHPINITVMNDKLFLVQKHKRILELLPMGNNEFHARAALHDRYDSSFKVTDKITTLSIGAENNKILMIKQ